MPIMGSSVGFVAVKNASAVSPGTSYSNKRNDYKRLTVMSHEDRMRLEYKGRVI